MDTLTVNVTDFIRNFGNYADLLPELEKINLIRDGSPFAEIRSSNEVKNRRLLALAGSAVGTSLDDDKLWKKVFTRQNRKHPVKLT